MAAAPLNRILAVMKHGSKQAAGCCIMPQSHAWLQVPQIGNSFGTWCECQVAQTVKRHKARRERESCKRHRGTELQLVQFCPMSSFLPISLQVRQIISKICEDSETLPAGYLIDQLTKMTFDRCCNDAFAAAPLPPAFLTRVFTARRAGPSRSSCWRSWRRTLPTLGSRLCASSSRYVKTGLLISSEMCSARRRESAAACSGKGRRILLWAMPSTKWFATLLRKQ